MSRSRARSAIQRAMPSCVGALNSRISPPAASTALRRFSSDAGLRAVPSTVSRKASPLPEATAAMPENMMATAIRLAPSECRTGMIQPGGSS